MITDPWFYLVAIPAVLIVGLSKSGFGSGLSFLGVPLMALIISPVQAAGILLPILVIMDMIGLLAYRRSFEKSVLKVMLPGAIIGVAVGWATAAYVAEAQVRLIVGIVALVFILNYWLGGGLKRPPAPPNTPKGVLWGSVAGFTSFVSHAGGPPFQMYALPLRMEPRLYAGTAVVFFTVVNAVKLIPYFALGQFTTGNLATSAALLPVAPIAVLLGVYFVKVLPMAPFYRLTYAAVFLVSLKLIWDGIAGLVA